jgi:hypothetical protein
MVTATKTPKLSAKPKELVPPLNISARNVSTSLVKANLLIVTPIFVTVASQLLEIEWFTCLSDGDVLGSGYWFQFRLSTVCKPPRV